MSIEQVSAWAAAACYLSLALLGITVWRERVRGSYLAPACAVQGLWALLALANPRLGQGLALLLELARVVAWLMVMIACLAGVDRSGPLRRSNRIAWGLIGGIFALWLVGGALSASGAMRFPSLDIRVWAGLGTSIAVLVVLEQVARNTSEGATWKLKYLWLAIGSLFTFDLCLWSLVLLHAGIGADLWLARDAVNVCAAGLIAVGVRRITSWSPDSFLARRITFFNGTLIATGCYVLVMAAASYGLHVYGGRLGNAIQAALLAGALIVLAIALFSDQFRAGVRVSSAKYLLPYHYNYRDEWLKLTNTLANSGDTPPYQRITRTMASFVNSPAAGLWLAGREGEFVPVGGELAPAGAPRIALGDPYLEHLLKDEWIEDLVSVRNGDSPTRALRPPEWLIALAQGWLVVPLICEARLIGFLVIARPLVQTRLGWEQLDMLRVSGRQVASFLAFEQAAKHLAEMSRFEALNRLSAFLMHDLRHLIAQQALVVENAARHRSNPKFVDDAILTIESSVKRMTRLMEQLRVGVEGNVERRVDMVEVCAEVVQRCEDRRPRPELHSDDRRLEVMADRERLAQVLQHLVRNAQDATSENGFVRIGLRRVSQNAVLEISDNGMGMDAEFVRQRLFRPFDTTKGSAGMGIGAFEAREFVRRIGGSVEVESRPGAGTTFRLHFPLASVLATGSTASYG